MENIYNYTIEELSEYFVKNNEKSFRSTQIYEWLYKTRITDFDGIKNVNKNIIENLKNNFNINRLKIISKLEGKDVVKYLFELEDGNRIEAVLLKQNYGNSLCISTQVGCNMGCLFCESGRLKKLRNLETYEMVLQILNIEEDLKIRISHLVLMGIGEPFDNYNNVMNFIKIVNHPKGIDIGSRHITISTCGIVPKIAKFASDGGQVNLAISLHAPTNEIRNKIMPINKAYNLEKLIKSIKKYIEITNRRVTFEYIMLDKINDKEEDAISLIKLLRGINCYVNLIPYNETNNSGFKKSKKESIMKFYNLLKQNKINVTIRKELGSNVAAACGQLRSKFEEEK